MSETTEHPTLKDKHGYPLRYVQVASEYPNRAERRKHGIRLPLQMLLTYTGLQQEALELGNEEILSAMGLATQE